MKQINNNIISSVLFLFTMGAYLALKLTGHADATTDQALFALLGLEAGHAIGVNSGGGTIAHINLPEGETK